MKHRTGSVLETLQRMDGVLDEHPTTFAPLKDSGARKALSGAIDQLATLAADQQSGSQASQGETSRQHALQTALRKYHMQGIAAAAKLNLPNVPDLSSLTMPPSGITAQRLIAASKAMSEAAKNHEQVLIAAGLPANFIAQLDAATQAVTDSLTGRNVQKGRRKGATQGLTAHETRARGVIKLVDAQVRPLIGGDSALLAEWDAAKRVNAKPGVKVGSAAAAAAADAQTQANLAATTTTSTSTSSSTSTSTSAPAAPQQASQA